MEKAARELHDIQERWKKAAEAPRAQAQTLWHRYRQAADPIQAKAREFFAARARRARGQPQGEARPVRARRGARRVHRLDQDRRGDEEAPGRVAGRPAPSRAPTRASSGSASATRATSSSRAATKTWRSARKCGRPTRRGRKRCAPAPRSSPKSRDWDKAAVASCAGCRPTGRPSARCAAPSRRRSGSASAPPPITSSIATSAATRSRSNRARPIAKRSLHGARVVPAGRRGRAGRAGRSAREGAVAAHAVEPVHDRRPHRAPIRSAAAS